MYSFHFDISVHTVTGFSLETCLHVTIARAVNFTADLHTSCVQLTLYIVLYINADHILFIDQFENIFAMKSA